MMGFIFSPSKQAPVSATLLASHTGPRRVTPEPQLGNDQIQDRNVGTLRHMQGACGTVFANRTVARHIM